LILEDLSVAEKSVLELIIGKNIEIRSANKTISNQKTSILKKLGLKNANELIKLLC
jgi:DNA-binding CsgD family transcriptional regulator